VVRAIEIMVDAKEAWFGIELAILHFSTSLSNFPDGVNPLHLPEVELLIASPQFNRDLLGMLGFIQDRFVT
jgi:hypothetical protein